MQPTQRPIWFPIATCPSHSTPHIQKQNKTKPYQKNPWVFMFWVNKQWGSGGGEQQGKKENKELILSLCSPPLHQQAALRNSAEEERRAASPVKDKWYVCKGFLLRAPEEVPVPCACSQDGRCVGCGGSMSRSWPQPMQVQQASICMCEQPSGAGKVCLCLPQTSLHEQGPDYTSRLRRAHGEAVWCKASPQPSKGHWASLAGYKASGSGPNQDI